MQQTGEQSDQLIKRLLDEESTNLQKCDVLGQSAWKSLIPLYTRFIFHSHMELVMKKC